MQREEKARNLFPSIRLGARARERERERASLPFLLLPPAHTLNFFSNLFSKRQAAPIRAKNDFSAALFLIMYS